MDPQYSLELLIIKLMGYSFFVIAEVLMFFFWFGRD